jgi:hypothetical protein
MWEERFSAPAISCVACFGCEDFARLAWLGIACVICGILRLTVKIVKALDILTVGV